MSQLIDLSNASVHGLSMMASGAWKVILVTQELSDEEAGQLAGALREGKQITTRIAPKTEGKTPSERLNAVLYRMYKQLEEQGKVKGDNFELFRSTKYEEIINSIKVQLSQINEK